MTPADHAATVRQALDTAMSYDLAPFERAENEAAVAALVALAERATELENELTLRLARIYENDGMQDFFARVAAGYEEHASQIEAAEARATELERELEYAWERAKDLARDRREQAERAERAETALLAVKHHPDTPEHLRLFVTRAALGETA